jgi:hypothetical protein
MFGSDLRGRRCSAKKGEEKGRRRKLHGVLENGGLWVLACIRVLEPHASY